MADGLSEIALSSLRYEADSRGLVYQKDDREVLPTGLRLPTLAGRSDITHDELSRVLREQK